MQTIYVHNGNICTKIASFESLDYHNKAYMKLLSVDNKKSPITAKIELDCEVKGTIKRKAVTVRQGDDLSEKLSGYREVYNGYVVDDIYCEKGNEYVSFTTKPEILRIGEAVGDIDDRAIKEQQIRKTIEEHLNKELVLNRRGIKVLSLWFGSAVPPPKETSTPNSSWSGKMKSVRPP